MYTLTVCKVHKQGDNNQINMIIFKIYLKSVLYMTECVRVLTVDYLGSVHYLWGGGGWQMGGGQAKFTPLFRGGQKGFALDLGKRGGGDKKV